MRDVAFSPAVEAQCRRINRAIYESVNVVGDVHGCRATLERLLQRVDPATDDLVVLVGDLVRRGPDSRGVIDLVRSTPNVVSVRGNNEEKIIRGKKHLPELTASDISWLRELPATLSWDGHLVVHGGIDPRKPRDELTVRDLQNTASISDDGGRPYWWEVYDGPERVFFGHKVLERPFVGPSAVGLDTRCAYGERSRPTTVPGNALSPLTRHGPTKNGPPGSSFRPLLGPRSPERRYVG